MLKRGDIILVDLEGSKGSEQGNSRPCCVVSNDIANKVSPVITVVPLTSRIGKRMLPTHVFLTQEQYPIHSDSIVLCEHIKTIDKMRIIGDVLFSLNELEMIKLNKAMMIQLGISMPIQNKMRNVI